VIEKFSISYVPSLTVLSEMKRIRTNPEKKEFSLFAAGNPKHGKMSAERLTEVFGAGTLEALPETEREVLEVAKLYTQDRTSVRIREDAREDILKKEAGNFDVVHFAAHGILNDASPMYSFILLSEGPKGVEDGMLEAWEIMEMDWKTRVAILSACDTARGRIAPGEGVIGLSWALFVAGVPSSLLSLWKVDSASTTQLMLEFHKNLAAQKNSLSRSAQQAALKVLRSDHYSHPFFWAGFALIGNSE
jgi:CHAT domain-containing protein